MPQTQVLSYSIPKNSTKSATSQMRAFGSPATPLSVATTFVPAGPPPVAGSGTLVLNQGELELMHVTITTDVVTDLAPGNPLGMLQRVITLTEVVPDFVNAFGPSELIATWKLETLWKERIEHVLSTVVTIP